MRKKMFLLLISCVLAIGVFCACGEVTIDFGVHHWLPATCTEPEICTICGETQGTPLGHTTEIGVCDRCNQNFGKGQKKHYLDKFGVETEDAYISNVEI